MSAKKAGGIASLVDALERDSSNRPIDLWNVITNLAKCLV